jgi:hypothetical protein
MNLNLTVFAPEHPVMNTAADWGITTVTTDSVDDQPFQIAAVPALFDDPDSYNFYKPLIGLDLSKFDLVLLSDIEYTNYTKIYEWCNQHQVKSFAVAVGGLFADIPLDTNMMVYRPWWMKNVQKLNHDYCADTIQHKPYLFDALLGTRRPHRDYVMLEMQRHPKLLEQCIVNYRDVFTPGKIPLQSQQSSKQELERIANQFPDQHLLWPYVSENLNPTWEVSDTITHSVSQTIPAKIYEQTWYSILCETIHTSTTFFMAEKFTKTVLAQRAFVMFGPVGYLAQLKQLGFKTFSSVIDEDYDTEERDTKRYQLAWAQVLSLSQQDPIAVYKKLQPVLEHNRQHIDTLWTQTLDQRQALLEKKIPVKYFS